MESTIELSDLSTARISLILCSISARRARSCLMSSRYAALISPLCLRSILEISAMRLCRSWAQPLSPELSLDLRPSISRRSLDMRDSWIQKIVCNVHSACLLYLSLRGLGHQGGAAEVSARWRGGEELGGGRGGEPGLVPGPGARRPRRQLRQLRRRAHLALIVAAGVHHEAVVQEALGGPGDLTRPGTR